jgi:hypothetical protein
MPKPTKLSLMTAADKATLFKMLRAGSSQKWACLEVGFDYDTLLDYRERASKKEEPFYSFIREVNQAQAGYVNERLRVLDADAVGAPLTGGRERGNGDIKWILERLHPKDFAPLQKQEHSGPDGAPLGLPAVEVIQLPALSSDGDPNSEG